MKHVAQKASASRTPQTTQAPLCCSPKLPLRKRQGSSPSLTPPDASLTAGDVERMHERLWGGPALLDLLGETTSDLIFRSARRRAGSTRRHTRTVSSNAAVAIESPRAENATALTMDAWPLSLPAGAPPRQSCTPLPAADANKGSASRASRA